MAMAMAGDEDTSRAALSKRAPEQMMPDCGRISGFLPAAYSGIATVTIGRRTRSGEAGSLSGPSHQMGRPTVLLVIAIAITLAAVRTQVINATVRHPSDKTLG